MDYFAVYKEVWDFHKKHSKVQTDDTYWEAVLDESKVISEKYKDSQFVKDLLMAIINELERTGNEYRNSK